MKVYATREFSKFAFKEGITDQALCEAVARAERGLIDADLPGAIIKQRVARTGQGAARGHRTVLVYRHGQLAVFVHGFSKNAKANLSPAEQEVYADLGGIITGMSVTLLKAAVARGKWREINCEQLGKNIS